MTPANTSSRSNAFMIEALYLKISGTMYRQSRFYGLCIGTIKFVDFWESSPLLLLIHHTMKSSRSMRSNTGERPTRKGPEPNVPRLKTDWSHSNIACLMPPTFYIVTAGVLISIARES